MSDNQNVKTEKFDKSEFLNALKQDFATTVNKVLINSTGAEAAFREISVPEQKTVSRILIENEHRKDVVYDTQCQLINTVGLTEGFDIYDMTEFDKTKILLALYQSNMPKNDMTFKCKECGTENKYRFDFRHVIAALDAFDTSPKDYRFENESRVFDFKLKYPTVRQVSQFYRQFAPKYRTMSKKEAETFNQQVNLDYVGLYIDGVSVTNKQTGHVISAPDMSGFSPAEREQMMSTFPQDVLYNENSVLTFIAQEFIQKMNRAFGKRKCGQCGAEFEDQIDQDVQSFF